MRILYGYNVHHFIHDYFCYMKHCLGPKVVGSHTELSTVSTVSNNNNNEVHFSMDEIPFSYRGGYDELLHTHYYNRLSRPCLNPSINPKMSITHNQNMGGINMFHLIILITVLNTLM